MRGKEGQRQRQRSEGNRCLYIPPAKANDFVASTFDDRRSLLCQVDQVQAKAVLDIVMGPDQSVICPRLVEKLEAAGTWLTGRRLQREVELTGFQAGLLITIYKEVK